MRKNWTLGFFGFLAFLAVPGLREGKWEDALWLLWVIWFIYFIPVGKKK